MEYFAQFFILLFVLPGIFSDAYPRVGASVSREEVLQEVIECEEFCGRFHRVCDANTYRCGECYGENVISRDGNCYLIDEPADDADADNHVAPDSDIDQLAAKRAHVDTEQAEDSNVVNTEPVEAHGEGAHIPKNAQINRILHAPGHSQDRKVSDVFKAAAEVDDMMQEPAKSVQDDSNMSDVYFLAVIAGCSIAGLIGLVVAGVCWYRLQKNVKAASESEYPAYGVTGPVPEKVASPGDRKLAQSAQMYHYQHQKQQMIAMEKANSDLTKDGSDGDSEEENEEGDYTVYECPGLAPTGEMEVKNPLFTEETPVTPSEHNVPK